LSKKSLYDILGVDEDAANDAIKRAYRRKAKETHPDRNEGKQEDFIEAHRAYAILSSPERRKKYDETGDESERNANSELATCISLIQNMMQSLIDQAGENIIYIDIIGEMKSALRKKSNDHITQIKHLKKRSGLYQKVLLKVKNKKKDGVIEHILHDNIKTIKHAIQSNQEQIDIDDRALQLLENYGFDFEKKAQPKYTTIFSNSTTASW